MDAVTLIVVTSKYFVAVIITVITVHSCNAVIRVHANWAYCSNSARQSVVKKSISNISAIYNVLAVYR